MSFIRTRTDKQSSQTLLHGTVEKAKENMHIPRKEDTKDQEKKKKKKKQNSLNRLYTFPITR